MKNLLKLGKALNKAEQKQINGGLRLIEDICNGCAYNPLENCCIHSAPCTATTVINANGLPMC